MPLTAGQLATFDNPSVGDTSGFAEQLPAPVTSLAEMLGGVVP
jgi:hypothetical protein